MLCSIYAGFHYGIVIYFFLDFTKGYGTALKWIGIILSGLTLTGLLFIGIDKFAEQKEKREKFII